MWTDDTTSLTFLRDALRRFNEERDWEQFHSAKDLAMCVSVEAGELLECFLWKSEDSAPDRTKVEQEMGDVLITLVNLANKLNIDLMRAAQRKLALNAQHYPVSKAKGRATKHTEL